MRALNLPLLLDVFLVSAVTALVVTRSYLAAAGYPQIGGSGLHVSHMLFGGVLMLAALLLALLYMGKAPRMPAAVVGGIGFGLFIDEFGKFVTSNNDYFYRPTFAIIYVLLIGIYLVGQAFLRRRHISPAEYLVNAIEALQQAAKGGLSQVEKDTALLCLDRSGDAELVRRIRELIEELPVRPESAASRFERWGAAVGGRVIQASEATWFRSVIVWVFVAEMVFLLLEFGGIAFFAGSAWKTPSNGTLNKTAHDSIGLSAVAVIELLTTLVAAVLVTMGIRRFSKSRERAYRAFERSLLISIFVTQVIAFFASWGIALVALLLTLPAWAALRALLEHERRIET
ncbi:MAG TPA: hypothetical protein VFY10_07415 [Dehalococcoidia bacterium]|nr:hypothetical protein [Dehalococcoidia bacterium]